MELNKEKTIKQFSLEKNREYEGNKITKAKVKCAGCGQWIDTTQPLGDVQISITKRGTGVFFHTACMKKVWKQKIAT